MEHEFIRAEMLLGTDGLNKLRSSKVAVFGVGGVGSFVVEALARCGVGHLVLIDKDNIAISNINRQLHATSKTIGKSKVEVMRDRILEINPKAQVTAIQKFYLPETASELLSNDYDYIVDAVDTLTAKIDLVVRAKEMGIPIISSMGAGNKMNPAMFEVADIYETSIDPIAKVMRRELRKRGIDSLKVVYSREVPMKPKIPGGSIACEQIENERDDRDDRDDMDQLDQQLSIQQSGQTKKTRKELQPPGSLSFVPSVAGLIIAGEVVKDLIGMT
ncbi:MAG TPA: tRNA threonylcarbamoyladenosine dehydratase [Clostridiaceae bacterium]|nr:tRNA threonylcarbamoyladenosine dehydratase [Clostridiaceae bacterium]